MRFWLRTIIALFCIGCVFPTTTSARGGAIAAGGVRETVAGVAARTQYAATASANVGPTQAPKNAAQAQPETGFYELVGGLGAAQNKIGKASLGLFGPLITDLLAQTHNDYGHLMGHVGLGYHYYLGPSDRYSDQTAWFPSIEPILNLYWYDIKAVGTRYLLSNPDYGYVSFEMPIHTTNLMIDVLLNIFTYKHFNWFILGGVGEAWTRLSYNDHPNSGFYVNPVKLNERSQSNNAYEWATGISYTFNPRLRLSFEYLYTHIGNIRTSGNGTLAGVPWPFFDPPGFSLRTQSLLLDVYVSFC